MRITAVVALFTDLPEAELTSWVARGWVRPDPVDPERAEAGWEFHEIDVARVRLIHDLHSTMEIGEDAMPLVLSLLDQVYDLRGTLRDLVHALEAQPADVRTTVLAALRRN
jgi:chaperone modulatory protein CbpM